MPTSIALTRFRELWIHTGTACNLSCPFCHEGSKPGDARLDALTLADITPLLHDAVAMQVERFAFTGGEPLVLREIHSILKLALSLRPVLVLTNGTAPYIRRTHQLAELRQQPHAARFHVSIDFADEARHDAGRGLKNFRKAFEGLRLLHDAGFEVGITRQSEAGEDPASVRSRFRNLLRKQRLPEDLPVHALPDLGALDAGTNMVRFAAPHSPDVAELVIQTGHEPTCSRGRMVIKRAGQMALVPCPLTNDDPRADLRPDIRVAIRQPVQPDYRRCAICLTQCVNYGAGA
jgi:hypothetical protein